MPYRSAVLFDRNTAIVSNSRGIYIHHNVTRKSYIRLLGFHYIRATRHGPMPGPSGKYWFKWRWQE